MFTNVIILSLLTTVYGINGEDGSRSLRDQNAFSFLDVPTQHEDLNFFKTPRAIRTPFRNTEIMTARGFGKRNGEEHVADDNGVDRQDFGNIDDKTQRSLFFPYFQEILKLPKIPENSGIVSAPIRNHRLQLRDGPLKFRLNDGNLRIGRGFGKRNLCFNSAEALKGFEDFKSKVEGDREET